jgi:hypothetical protein
MQTHRQMGWVYKVGRSDGPTWHDQTCHKTGSAIKKLIGGGGGGPTDSILFQWLFQPQGPGLLFSSV